MRANSSPLTNLLLIRWLSPSRERRSCSAISNSLGEKRESIPTNYSPSCSPPKKDTLALTGEEASPRSLVTRPQKNERIHQRIDAQQFQPHVRREKTATRRTAEGSRRNKHSTAFLSLKSAQCLTASPGERQIHTCVCYSVSR